MPNAIDPVDNAKLAMVQGRWEAELDQLKALPCSTPEQERWWGDIITRAQAELRELEDDRTAVTKPINDDLRRINGCYKPVVHAVETVKTLAKAKIAEAINARFAAEAAAMTALAAAAASGDDAACGAALAAIPAPVANAGVRTSFRWEVAEIKKSQLSKEWLVPDVAGLEALCKQTKGEQPPVVKGVAFKRVAVVAANGKR